MKYQHSANLLVLTLLSIKLKHITGVDTNLNCMVACRATKFYFLLALSVNQQPSSHRLLAESRSDKVGRCGRGFSPPPRGGVNWGPPPENFGNKHAKSCILAVFLRKIVTLSIKCQMFFYLYGRNMFYKGKQAYIYLSNFYLEKVLVPRFLSCKSIYCSRIKRF